jgi:preprotein translocase subunit SecD
MSVEQNVAPGRTAYGRVIRERGTMRLVILAIVAAIAWYAIGELRTYQLNQKQWAALDPDIKGMTVLGIQTRDRPGKKAPYVVRSSNKSFQIRYREEDEKGEEDVADQTEESKDRGNNNPGATHNTNQGSVVPMEELYKFCPTVLSGSSFSGASIEEDVRPVFEDHYWRVNVDLTPEGQSRYYQYSSKHEREKLAFIIGDEVLACPEMRAMNTSSLTLEPIWIKADAQRLADFINKKK